MLLANVIVTCYELQKTYFHYTKKKENAVFVNYIVKTTSVLTT